MIKLPINNVLRFVLTSLLILAIGFICRINLVVSLILILLYLYLHSSFKTLKDVKFLNITLLYLSIVATGFILIKEFPALALYILPYSIIPMLTVLLFNNIELTLVLTVALSFTLSSFFQLPFHMMALSLSGGIISAVLTKDARKRTTIIRAGFVVGIVQVFALIFLDRFWFGLPSRYLLLFLNGIASSIIVLGVLPIFEYLFKIVTNISLLELADFNHPLLARMTLEAPGTYHHSLIVGNLSESACQAVGANSLLARIGAYYHDIGKLHKPEYFSENQDLALSKHDNLTPTMSKLVIMNHVKEGIELAKKYRLKPALLDFITQHHGNSLVYYFYRRALEGLEDDQEIKEEGFRYPGPKPSTKETAIVLLADSVEAATRAMSEPSPAKINELVRKIINNKFIDGQLDECELTLKDLEKISAVFTRILGSVYHARVNYPENRSENNHKKPSKEDSRLSGKDKKGSS